MDPKTCIESFCQAIEKKNLSGIKALTLTEEPIAVVLTDGYVIDNSAELFEFFESWFEEKDWSITHELLFLEESDEMALGLLSAEYFSKEDGEAISGQFMMTVGLRKIDGDWKLIHYQQNQIDED